MSYHSQLKRGVDSWLRDPPLPLKIALAVSPFFLGIIAARAMKEATRFSNVPEWQLAASAIAAIVCLVALTLVLRPRGRETISLPANIKVHRAFSPEALEELRHGLHRDIYHGVEPKNDEIDRMYRKNPRMGVGLYDTAKSKYVAFATGWPLTDGAARSIMSGERTENDLTADDILPQAGNGQANFVLIPAFGATDQEGRWQQSCLGLLLREEMRKALKENFFSGRRKRPLTLLATGFSKGGIRVCESHDLAVVQHVAFPGSGKKVPIFSGKLTRDRLS